MPSHTGISLRSKHIYQSEEADNISLGQNGFDMLEGRNSGNGSEYVAGPGTDHIGGGGVYITYFPDVNFWISIKAMSRTAADATPDDSGVVAKSLIGDDLMKQPEVGYDGVMSPSTYSSYKIVLQADDVINGCFSKIRIVDGRTYIQALRG